MIFQKQQYSSYASENLMVWDMLYKKLEAVHQAHACSDYLEGKDKLGFNSSEIPNFDNINDILSAYESWEVVAVDGIVDTDKFFYCLSNKKFPVTPWIRPLEKAYSYDDADMLHDMLGHIPLLTNFHISKFLHSIGQMVVECNYDECFMESVARIYWRTIEVGLVAQDGMPKIFGAALLSSLGESQRSIGQETPRFDFDFDTCVNSSFFYDREQDEYFVIESLEELESITAQLRTLSKKQISLTT